MTSVGIVFEKMHVWRSIGDEDVGAWPLGPGVLKREG
jgi:hypothetical protein